MIPSHLVAKAWRILEQIPTLRADSEPAVHVSDETESQPARSVQENRFSKEASARDGFTHPPESPSCCHVAALGSELPRFFAKSICSLARVATDSGQELPLNNALVEVEL
jgi:hypothetical protein